MKTTNKTYHVPWSQEFMYSSSYMDIFRMKV